MKTNPRFSLIFNSFLILFSAYLVLHIISITLMAAGADLLFDIPSTLSRWGLRFQIPDSSDKWTHFSVIGIYIITPIVMIVAILFSLRKFFGDRFKRRSAGKLFFIWIYLHASNQFFGGLGLGVILKTGSGYVPRWMGVTEPFIYVFPVVALIFLMINGLIVNDYLSAYAFKEEQLIKVKDQVRFKFDFVVLPVLVFVAGCLIFGFPDRNLYTIGLHLTLLLPLPGIVFYHECLCETIENPKRWKKPFFPVLIMIGIGMLGLSLVSVI